MDDARAQSGMHIYKSIVIKCKLRGLIQFVQCVNSIWFLGESRDRTISLLRLDFATILTKVLEMQYTTALLEHLTAPLKYIDLYKGVK